MVASRDRMKRRRTGKIIIVMILVMIKKKTNKKEGEEEKKKKRIKQKKEEKEKKKKKKKEKNEEGRQIERHARTFLPHLFLSIIVPLVGIWAGRQKKMHCKAVSLLEMRRK